MCGGDELARLGIRWDETSPTITRLLTLLMDRSTEYWRIGGNPLSLSLIAG